MECREKKEMKKEREGERGWRNIMEYSDQTDSAAKASGWERGREQKKIE